MSDVNNKPIEAPSFPITIKNWSLLVIVLATELSFLTRDKKINRLKLKKDDWHSFWKSAKTLYYFYQNEVKPYAEKNKPAAVGDLLIVFGGGLTSVCLI